MNRIELLNRAKDLGIAGRHRMAKSDLLAAIRQAEPKSKQTGPVHSEESENGWNFDRLRLMPPEDSAAAQLRRALQEKVVDRWPIGTVLRWESDGGRQVYIYSAVRAPGGRWFTSAAEYNRYVPQIVDYDDLVEILSRSETHNIQYASGWTDLHDA